MGDACSNLSTPACGYSGVRVAAIFEKVANFLAFVVKVGVVTPSASPSNKFKQL